MLLLGLSLHATLLFLLLASAIPLNSRGLNPAAVPNEYMSSSQNKLTIPILNPNPPAYHALCFNPEARLNLSAVAEDCSTVISHVILRLDEPFKKRPFSGQRYMNSDGHWVPSRWILGQCSVFVNSVQNALTDYFTLLEVALTASIILSDCVSGDGKDKGGLLPIKSHQAPYFVGLQGYQSGIDVNASNDADMSAIPGFEVSKRTQDVKQAIRGSARLQPRTLYPKRPLVSLNEGMSLSNSTENLDVEMDYEVDCYPRGSFLPNANEDDCRFIINTIIPSMKDPLRSQTWGFTDAVDINLSLAENHWVFKHCSICVKNIDEEQVDRFRPVDVAAVAQRILQKCVTHAKEPIGGNADIGHLEFPRRFYVVLSGTTSGSGESVGNDIILLHPPSGPRTLQSRSTLVSPEANSLRMIPSEGLTVRKRYPVHCFDPSSERKLLPAIVSDCNIVINDVILRLPNPMKDQTFGYTDAADINLSESEYNDWYYGQCVVFIRHTEGGTARDRFRFIDVAYTVQRIMDQCLDGSKFAIGGMADVGTTADNFYVGISGHQTGNLGNGTSLELVSGTDISSLSNAPSASQSRSRTESRRSNDYIDTKPVDLDKRSSNITKLAQTSFGFAPTVRCIKPGMPAARKIELQDCTDAIMVLLGDPKILVPQPFTTEPTGGIKMPFVRHNQSCYLMMDTTLDLSITDSIALLKMVYWALEIILACISGRQQGFGGISKLDRSKGIFVSVTGVNPAVVGNGLAGLWGESASAMELENTSLQIVGLGQS